MSLVFFCHPATFFFIGFFVSTTPPSLGLICLVSTKLKPILARSTLGSGCLLGFGLTAGLVVAVKLVAALSV